jgi:predicted nucleic acid-binding protein
VPLISTITLAELSVGPLVATSERDRADRQAVLQQAEADFNPLPFDAAAARAFGRLAAALRRSGRKPHARVQRDDRRAHPRPTRTHQQSGWLRGHRGLAVVPVPVPG